MSNEQEESKTGIVEGKHTHEGSTSGKAWKRFVLTIDGQQYSTFEEKLYNEAQMDKPYTVYFKASGQYKNLVRVEPAEAKVETKKEFKQASEVPQGVWQGKDLRMVKMNALTNANALIANLIELDRERMKKVFDELESKEQKPIDLILEIATVLKDWVNSGTDLS